MVSYRFFARAFGGLVLVACIGGCNNSLKNYFKQSNSSASSAAATGIWSGVDSNSGEGMVGIINSDGQADFIRDDGIQFTGTVQISGDTLAATLNGYTNFGFTLPDGSTSGVGTVNATVVMANSIVGNLTFTSDNNTSYPESWSLTYLSLSTSGSSLSAINGNYTDTSSVANSNSGGTVSIGVSGNISSRGATSGCVMDGSIGVGDASTDIYEISYTYSGCTGKWAELNSVPFTGLAILKTTLSPAQLFVGVTGQTSNGTKYGLVNSFSVH